LIYHQLAARVNWHGCKNGQPARIQTIVDAICHDSKKRGSLIKECERNATIRHNCQREAMSRIPEAWEEAQYPGIPLRRCPACLKAVPKQSVQCLQCWGHLLTEDGIAEIRDTKEMEEIDTKSKGVTLERRTSHDVEYQIEGEIIQFPCVDVRRFRVRHKIHSK